MKKTQVYAEDYPHSRLCQNLNQQQSGPLNYVIPFAFNR